MKLQHTTYTLAFCEPLSILRFINEMLIPMPQLILVQQLFDDCDWWHNQMFYIGVDIFDFNLKKANRFDLLAVKK